MNDVKEEALALERTYSGFHNIFEDYWLDCVNTCHVF